MSEDPNNVFAAEGVRLELGSNQPFSLASPSDAWFIEAGKVDVFAVPTQNGEPAGPRTHLFRAEAGQVLFGIPSDAGGQALGFVAVGANDTRVYRLPLVSLSRWGVGEERARQVAGWVDPWVQLLYTGLRLPLPPPDAEALQPPEEVGLAATTPVRASDRVAWVTARQGRCLLAGLEELPWSTHASALPLTTSSWLYAAEDATLMCEDTVALLSQARLWPSLEAFYGCVAKGAAFLLRRAEMDETSRLQAKEDSEHTAIRSAVSHLSSLLAPESDRRLAQEGAEDPLFAACQLVGRAQGIALKPSSAAHKWRTQRDPLSSIAKASRVRVRRVILGGDWWRQDNGPILAFRQEGSQPVALIPVAAGRYELVDPATGAREAVDPGVAQTLHPVAHTFCGAFGDGKLKLLEVFRFGLQGARRDLLMLALMGVAGGVLGTLVPIVTGVIFDSVIPGADRPQLVFLALALFVAAFAEVIFGITQGIALLRLEAKSDASIQAAVWDRLLRLPLPFFRSFTAGDLALRANGINAIRQEISGTVVRSVLSGVFSVFNFALLCYYSIPLTLVAAALIVLNLGATALVSYLSLRYQRPLCELEGRISGQVLQFITGISKLRVAGAELHAYAVWAKGFSAQKQLDLRAGRLGIALGVFNEVYPILTSICLFGSMAFLLQKGLSTGQFLAFSAAFMVFLNATLDAGSALITVLNIVPLYERTRPILETVPEVTEAKAEPGPLDGRIELSHINFRYKSDGPLILQDLSLQIRPGEFIAVVGPSGSGKSTLMRLLLGFETPESGTIYFDGLDLAGLDVQSVRRQCGVVLQHGKLMPGDIYENIVGSSLRTLDEAWDAARKSGLEEDIQEMPMGMHTVLGEGSGTLSGGQRQRLMIARAIVNKPRILLFDEATSALDNRTQAIVSQSLEELEATRIVIAHRLSTIEHADRIFVLSKGRLVQSGTYRQLLEQPGPFADLARRQLI